MVPTTLLAQVDSSVGGKTGVNRPQGKNLVGVFYQPSLVIADVATLTSLSEREYRAGLAEVVKYGVILDAPLFETLEAESARIEQRDGVLMAEIVARCSALKASVVERDEKESSGYRAVLNFGHTVGHGLENLTGYGSYLHGEAVAVGMAAAARVSASLGECDPGVAGRIEGLLAVLGLDCRMPTGLDRDELARAIAFDKKVSGGEVGFVVCTGVGGCRLRKMSPTDIASAV
jgi:3-dehydroquinate synthase